MKRACSTNADKISSLPDHLLSQILSFLPTKDAAATSALSRRWRHVFTWVTSLDFDDSPISLCICWPPHPPRDDRFSTFKSFVDSVLGAHQSEYVTRFRLKFGEIPFPYYSCYCKRGCFPKLKPVCVNAWMRFLLALGVRDLDLHFRVRNPGKMPWIVFSCETLEVLKLDVNLDFDPHMPIHLPKLKVFHLHSLTPIDDLVTELVSRCSSLEDLSVHSYRQLHKDQVITIVSPYLRRLCVYLDELNTAEDTPAAAVVFDTPNLQYFTYIDNILPRQLVIASMNHLVESKISHYYYTTNDDEKAAFRHMLNFLKVSSNVQRLYVHNFSSQALLYGDIEGKIPVFHHLKILHLGQETIGMGSVFLRYKLILELLHCSPVLEALHFPQGVLKHGRPTNWKETPECISHCCKITGPIPFCCGSSLKRIAVDYFRGTESELKVLEFLLQHARVLEELCFYGDRIEDLETEFETKLKMLPRSSINCSIRFCPELPNGYFK